MSSEAHAVEWSHGVVTARRYGDGSVTVLLAHGAGTDQDHPLLVGLATSLSSLGLGVVTFNYPYSEAGKRAPDRAPILLTCHRDIAEWVRVRFPGPLVMAGRSMGGRMATILAAEREPMDGVVAYAYPLHPAGKPDRLRTEHLDAVAVPALFFQGDRDALARADLFDRFIRSRPGFDVVDLEGVDHSWRARGRTLEELTATVAGDTASWIGRLASRGDSQA
jgi:uncharacterized protein